MPNKSLYVPPQDEALWDAAQRVAKRKRISLSRLVTDALEVHVPKVAAEPAPPPADRWNAVAAESNAA